MPVLCFHPDAIDLDNPVAPRPRPLRLGQTKDVAQDRADPPNRMPSIGTHQWNRAAQMPDAMLRFFPNPSRPGNFSIGHHSMIRPHRQHSPLVVDGVDRRRMHNVFDIYISHVTIRDGTARSDQPLP